MITFETQEDFEEAVINIIKQRLEISTRIGEYPNVYLSINRWNHSGDDVPQDDQFSYDSIPTPSLRY